MARWARDTAWAVAGVGGAFGLRMWAMRTLQGHYAHTLRVVDDQPVVRSGPYRFVRHPGYLSVGLLWLGAATSSRTVVAPAYGRLHGRLSATFRTRHRSSPGQRPELR